MTTLFPQIKRVDEDETSKIIKNVLFDDQDEVKLEQIFDEFMHLTEESITYSDEDDDDEDDSDDGDGSEDENNEEDDDEDDDDEDDDDDDDDDDDEDSDSDSEESDSSESEDDKPQPKAEPPASREPTSWNLDQFIKKIPVTTTKPPSAKVKAEPVVTSPEASISAPSSASSVKHEVEPKQEPQRLPEPKLLQSELLPEPVSERKLTPERKPTPECKPTPDQKPTPDRKPTPDQKPTPDRKPTLDQRKPTQDQRRITQEQRKPSGSYLVQIDLSKLKRIPTTKVPTPTTCSNSMLTAKTLKHQADAEKDKTKQAIKYLESAMYFILHGWEVETSTKNSAFYGDTIPLFKHALRLSAPGLDNQDNMTSLKVHTLGLRCLSLIYMKLYKIRERELHENQKIINSQQNSSPLQQDGLLVGVRPQLLSSYKRQIQIFNLLKYANELWQSADQLCEQHPAVRIFFSTIESNCGTLTMVSQFTKLMDHVKCGLKLLRS